MTNEITFGDNRWTGNVFSKLFPSTLNNQLRTGTDDAIPLIIEKQSIAMASSGVDTVLSAWCSECQCDEK